MLAVRTNMRIPPRKMTKPEYKKFKLIGVADLRRKDILTDEIFKNHPSYEPVDLIGYRRYQRRLKIREPVRLIVPDGPFQSQNIVNAIELGQVDCSSG